MEFIRKISLGASAEYEKCKTFDEKKSSKLVQKFVKDRNVSVYAAPLAKHFNGSHTSCV